MVTARPGRKIIFLTGAPLSRSLLWDDKFLSASLQEPFMERSKPFHYTPLSANTGPVWRCLFTEHNGIHAGLMSPISANNPNNGSGCDCDSTPFLNPTHHSQLSAGSSTDLSQSLLSSSQLSEEGEPTSQFYEESYAIHEEVSSEMMGNGSSNDTPSGESFDDTSNSLDVEPPGDAKANMVRTRLMASLPRNLSNLPNAAYLQSITPQTVTINVVVGIISILPPREITTRRGGRTVHLVELLVGDDTRAGFAINIWLNDLPKIDRVTTSTTNTPSDQILATVVTHLRPRDIILIRNAALSSYQGKVYGQSLRKGMTTIDLLHRNVVDSTDTYGAYSAHELREMLSSSSSTTATEGSLLKMKRVKQWVMDFVGMTAHVPPHHHRLKVDNGGDSDKGTKRRQRETTHLAPLPLDTQ